MLEIITESGKIFKCPFSCEHFESLDGEQLKSIKERGIDYVENGAKQKVLSVKLMPFPTMVGEWMSGRWSPLKINKHTF